MAIVIHPSAADAAWACAVAHRRQDEAVRAGRPDRHGFDGHNGFEVHLLGAAGELAVCRALGLRWPASVNTFKAPDIGGILQVKTRSSHRYDLLVRPIDRDDEYFIHVTGNPSELTIHGWMLGRDAKQAQWLKTWGGRPAAYFVPKFHLNILEDL